VAETEVGAAMTDDIDGAMERRRDRDEDEEHMRGQKHDEVFARLKYQAAISLGYGDVCMDYVDLNLRTMQRTLQTQDWRGAMVTFESDPVQLAFQALMQTDAAIEFIKVFSEQYAADNVDDVAQLEWERQE